MRHRKYNSMRFLHLVFALAAFCVPAFGQAAAIQPCEATPAAKPAASAPAKTNVRSSQTNIDSSIPADEAVEKMLEPYSGKVRALSNVIGQLDGPIKKEAVGAGSLGQFVTDGVKTFAQSKLGKPVALTIMNAGGLRKNEIAAGDVRATDIFELLPFENALVAVELRGADLLKVLPALARDAQAGARIQYKWNDQSRPEFISAKLLNANGQEEEIDPNKTYTIVTIDYLLRLAGGSYAILKEAKAVTPLGITLRNAMMEYVKSETAAGRKLRSRVDDRYVQVGPGPQTPPEPPR
jgi:2',3'-cyclic-nucleotide 2'-phosphodiesterase (5'-nucleotidase family)